MKQFLFDNKNIRDSAIFILILTTLIAGWQGYAYYQASQTLFLELEMQTKIKGATAKVHYDTGAGFNGKESSRLWIQGTGRFESLRFDLATKPVLNLRLDFLNLPGEVKIRQIAITDGNGRQIQPIGLEAVKPAHQIAALEPNADSLLVRTTDDARNSRVTLDISYPLFSSPNRQEALIYALVTFFMGLVLGSGIIFISYRFAANNLSPSAPQAMKSDDDNEDNDVARTTPQIAANIFRLSVFPIVFYLTFFCILTYPLIWKFSTHFFADQGDGLQHVWNIWWVNKAVTELG